MQVNVDITVACPCNALVINVVDESNDRLLASEILKMDDVEFTGPQDDIAELWHSYHKNSNHDESDEGPYGGVEQFTANKEIFDLLSNSDDLDASSLENRKETLHSVLKRTGRISSKFKRSQTIPKAQRKELAHAIEKPEDVVDIPKYLYDGSLGCRIYGSMPVTKVQGNLHIISKAYYLSAGHLTGSQQQIFSSIKARNDLWHQHQGRFPLSHYIFSQVNFTHYIDELSFGPYYPSLVNPLDGTKSRWPRRTLRNRLRTFFKQHSENQKSQEKEESLVSGISQDKLKGLVQTLKNQASAISAYQYFVSIVPTTYIASTTGRQVKTNQYAVTEDVRDLSWKYEFDDDLDNSILLSKTEEESAGASEHEEKKLALLRKALKAMYIIPGKSKAPISTSNEDDDHNLRSTSTPPGIYIKYDINPVSLQITDTRLPFAQFVVRVVNILGGLVVCTSTFYRVIEALLLRIGGKRWKAATDLDNSQGILDNKDKVKELVEENKEREKKLD